jgi:purine catabolism regulator
MNSFTIEKLLSHLNLESTALKAGKKGDDIKIFGAGIIENPDYFDWFSAGDFILTTGYIFQSDPDLQRKLVKELADQNCSGLGIKVKKYWDQIPEAILEEANRRKLPIIEIPYTYSLSLVSKIINAEVNEREDSVLKKYRMIHDAFSKCSIDGGDLWEIVKLTSDLVDNPIIMLDSRFNLLSFYERENNPVKLVDHLQLIVKERVFSKEFTDGIPTSTKKFTLSIKRNFPDKESDIVCRVIPIAYSQTIYGYIIVWEVTHKLEHIDYIALENAAQSAAMERVKTKQMVEAEHKLKEGFYDDLLQGKIVSVNAAKSLAEIHGMNPLKNHICSVINTNDAQKSTLQEILNICIDVGMKCRRRVRSIIRENNIIMFIELEDSESRYEPSEAVREFLERLDQDIHTACKNIVYRIGVSNVCTDFLTIGKSCLLAQDVLRISAKLPTSEGVFYFNDLISYHLLDSTVDKDRLKSFFDATLGKLRDYDKENNSRFMSTLEAYFLANGNVSVAAKTIYVHRNTFIYRIEKIKDILHTDLKDADYNFNCQLAFHISKIIDVTK